MSRNWEQYQVNTEKSTPSIDWEQFAAPLPSSKKYQPQEEMENTFIGKLPTSPLKAPFGSEKSFVNPTTIKELAYLASGGSPGMNIVGQAAHPGIITALLKMTGKGIAAPFKAIGGAIKNIEPYEQAAEQGVKESLESIEAAKTAKQLKPGTINYGQTGSELENLENQIGRNLNIGAAHHLRVGDYLRNRIGDINKYWSDRYQNFVNNISKSKFQMPEKQLKKLDEEAIKKAVQSGNLEDVIKGKIGIQEESPYLKDLMNRAPNSNDTDAATFLSKYKDFRNGLYDMKQEVRLTKDEAVRRQLFNDIKEAEKTETILKDVLENGLGEHAAEFKELNKGYSSQVFPLRTNKIVRKLMNPVNPGKLSENMVKEFSGPGEGQELLREIVKQHPESVRNIIGQRYSIKPGEIHNPNELMREYMDEYPEIKELISSKETELKNIARRKDISLEKKIKAEKELENIKEKKEASKKALSRIGKSIFGGSVIYGAVKGAKSLINLLEGNE